MEFWINLWKLCLIVALLAFSVMAVLTIVGGARDIRKLITRLNKPPNDEERG